MTLIMPVASSGFFLLLILSAGVHVAGAPFHRTVQHHLPRHAAGRWLMIKGGWLMLQIVQLMDSDGARGWLVVQGACLMDAGR